MQSSTMIRRTRVEVDLTAVVGNARTVRALTGTDVFAVVKADGYGHGAVAVARALAAARAVSGFAVSLVEEGVLLRDAGVSAPVLVMGPSQHGGEDDMVMAGLTPHCACADSDDPDDADSKTRDQLREFGDVDRAVTATGAPVRVRHAANR